MVVPPGKLMGLSGNPAQIPWGHPDTYKILSQPVQEIPLAHPDGQGHGEEVDGAQGQQP